MAAVKAKTPVAAALESDEFSDDDARVSAPPPVRSTAQSKPLPPKQKVELSFEDSSDHVPRTLDDLRHMPDDFESDSDARAAGLESERLVIHGEAMYADIDDSSTAELMSESVDGEGQIISADKLLFMQLPEPLAPAGSAGSLESVIDVLDHSDPMLRIIQSKIRGFRDYLHVVEREEVVLLKQFNEEVAMGKVATEPGQIAEQESNRVHYERRLASIRDRRSRFRGLLYDAIQERGSVVQAHLQRHGIGFRAREKLDYFRDRSGLDAWLIGFFLASLVIVVCYVVFLTFPTASGPTFRIVLPVGAAAYEFDYRLTVLTSLFVVVGMSFWMTSYKRFQWSALALNLVLVGWSIEFGLLMHVFFEWAFITGFRQVPLTAQLATLSLNSAATVLVSHAVLLGRINVTQGLVMATLQCICFAIIIGFQRFFLVVDNGGGVAVWTFGALFGLVASVVYALDGEHHKPDKPNHQRQTGKRYNEELKSHSHPRRVSYKETSFAWIGTLVLWVLWPVFNSALAPPTSQARVLIVTLVALIFSTITAVALSEMLFGRKHTLRTFLNSTLAGGVAMGSASSVLVPPWIAALLGIVVGAVSVLGEWRLMDTLENSLKVYDTQGVLWTILIPATLGFLVSAIVTAAGVGQIIWGNAFSVFFSDTQASYLAASWALVLGFALLVGAATGFLLRYLRPSARKNQLWREDAYFLGVEDYAQY